MKGTLRNLTEFAVIFVLWSSTHWVIAYHLLNEKMLTAIVLGGVICKTAFFGAENLRQLWRASCDNVPYHQFMQLMLINMSQIITSFALDYHVLYFIDHQSFGMSESVDTSEEVLFEFFYYSVLNFTFFGYGDMTPQTVPAKIITMSEVLLAFVTFIFLLSDFISLKESIRANPDSVPPADK